MEKGVVREWKAARGNEVRPMKLRAMGLDYTSTRKDAATIVVKTLARHGD